MSINQSTIDSIKEEYHQALQARKEYNSIESIESLLKIYNTVNKIIKEDPDANENLKKKLEAELTLLEAAAYEDKEITINDIRSMIIKLTEAANSLANREVTEPSKVPTDILELLKSIDFPIEIISQKPIHRAYVVAETAKLFSGNLYKTTRYLEDLDAYLVTLVKTEIIVVEVNLDEAKEQNDEILSIARFLYNKTKDKRFIDIIASALLAKEMTNHDKKL